MNAYTLLGNVQYNTGAIIGGPTLGLLIKGSRGFKPWNRCVGIVGSLNKALHPMPIQTTCPKAPMRKEEVWKTQKKYDTASSLLGLQRSIAVDVWHKLYSNIIMFCFVGLYCSSKIPQKNLFKHTVYTNINFSLDNSCKLL